MTKAEKALTRGMGWLLAALIFVMMCDIFAEVIVRYVLRESLSFSEELGRYVFVWIVFIGMSYCVAYEKHVALDILPNAFQGKAKKLVMTLIYLLQTVFFLSLTAGGFALYQIGSRQRSATMRIPMNLVYLCIPVCGICSLFFIAMKMVRLIQNKQTDSPQGGENV